jgi:hypothetical protein
MKKENRSITLEPPPQWTLKGYWEEVHQKGHAACSSPGEVLRDHNLSAYLDGPNKQIMEIGIGDGSLVRHFAQYHKVTAVDIAPSALTQVADVSAGVLTGDMEALPGGFYNLAIAHLVLQHCEDDMVKHIVKQTLRVLKRSGAFSFQFAFLAWGDKLMPDGGWYGDRGLVGKYLFFRTPHEMKAIVEEAGGEVVWVSKRIEHGQMGWHIFHARRV